MFLNFTKKQEPIERFQSNPQQFTTSWSSIHDARRSCVPFSHSRLLVPCLPAYGDKDGRKKVRVLDESASQAAVASNKVTGSS